MNQSITFQVDTRRVLQILASEIYDSPYALLRENLQNAYDAVRMRFASASTLTEGGRIDIRVADRQVVVIDNGIGMTEPVLRENFWKAGSSGKHSEVARRAGVVGTFGIGAMANFGVCTRLVVETRALGRDEVLRSTADRDSLKIAEPCITLESSYATRDFGTTVTAFLDEDRITADQARRYLEPYVALLPVPVYVNDQLISCGDVESRLRAGARTLTSIGSITLQDGLCGATFTVSVDPNAQVRASVVDISVGGTRVDGMMALLQGGGQLMGLRSWFGLAPIPVAGAYQFGGLANLEFLQPTAGREALSRDSINLASRLIGLAERASSELIAATLSADRNNAFLQWLASHRRYDLAHHVSIHVLPDKLDIALGDVKAHIASHRAHYYAGTDATIVATFANEETYLLQVAQGNPRRSVQLEYVTQFLRLPQVPDAAQIVRMYLGTELTVKEAALILRVGSILRDDYLIPDVDVVLADISHGVTLLARKDGEQLKLYLARSSSLLPPLFEVYERAYDLFTQFVKDFVRGHVYPKVQQYVPSSTRDGVDALRKLLQRNRELYRYEETDLGELEGLLGEYLSGAANFTKVLQITRSTVRAQTQRVSIDQVGPIEREVPGLGDYPELHATEAQPNFAPTPPIVRESIATDMKILTTSERYPLLNNFTMLLGLSDRLMRTEAEFFHVPHTTRVIWGGHRVIYIFTEATQRLSLYYDIELREPLDQTIAGGAMLPTTTLITRRRIFVPIPDALVDQFKIASGPKEFFVRFDVLTGEAT